MPRRGKGAATQPARTSADQAYGVAGEQKAAMGAMPLPDNTIDPGAATPAAPGPAQPQPASEQGPPGIDPALLAAMATAPPTGDAMVAPSADPAEPVTAGMNLGPGPGREVVPLLAGAQPKQPVADALTLMARANGNNAALSALAAEAARRNQ